MSRGSGDQRDLVELLEVGEEEELENSGFADDDGNEVSDPSNEDADLTSAESEEVTLPARVIRPPAEVTHVSKGVVRRRPKA